MDKTVLEMISSGAPLPDVLQVLSQIIEEQRPGTLVSILLPHRGGRTLRHAAAPSLSSRYTQAIDALAHGPFAGFSANGAQRGQTMIVPDIRSDQRWASYRELALGDGLQACWSTPIVSEGEFRGIFALYYREARTPKAQDLEMIERAVHLAAIAVDRSRTEEALKQAERQYRGIVENAVEGFFQASIDGRYLSVNPALARMHGYASPGQLLAAVKDIGRQVYVDPTRRKDFQRLMEERGVVEDFEYQAYRKDGHKIWVSENARAVRDPAGAMLYYEGTVQDITLRKRASEALAESEERFRLLFDEAPVAYHEIDSQGIVRRVNQAECNLLGYHRADILGRHVSDFVAEEERERSRDAVQRKMMGEIPLAPFQREFARADGTHLLVEIHENLIRDASGHIVGVRSALLDITERKQLEEQLRQALKMEAVGRLAGGIAHDFNNLLMVIKGHSELILNRLPHEEPLRKNAEEIDKATERAASLTRQLLAFSRMQVLQPKVLDLNAIVADTSKMLDRVIGENIELVVKLGASLRGIKADHSQIEQVILNLVVNARDAMPHGGKLIIETSNVTLDDAYRRKHTGVRPGKYVMLAVSDNGTGMDAETQAHIFEPFFTTKLSGKGTGLGLATVYGVIKQSGGWIWVYSQKEKGTTFKIYLPQADEGEIVASHERSTTVGAPRGSETILLVEDQESIRELVEEFLESRGYRIVSAQDGAEALQIMESEKQAIDLLLTDVVMPKVSGPELSRRLASLLPKLKVLYISGYAEHSPANTEIVQGNAICLQKPFALDALDRQIRSLLDSEASPVIPSQRH
jgi:PAS domain S-box-containing protein